MFNSEIIGAPKYIGIPKWVYPEFCSIKSGAAIFIVYLYTSRTCTIYQNLSTKDIIIRNMLETNIINQNKLTEHIIIDQKSVSTGIDTEDTECKRL